MLRQDAVRVLFGLGGLGLGLGGAVLHNFVHGGGVQLLHKLAGELGPVGPNHLVDGGAHAVGPLLDHLLLALQHVGVGDPLGGEGGGFGDVIVIGQLGGDIYFHAVLRQLYADHLQGAGVDVETAQQGGDAFLVGLDGDGGALMPDGDGGVFLQGDVVAPAAVGDVDHLGREVRGLLLLGVQDDGGLVLRPGDEKQGVGPAGGGKAGDGGDEQAEQQHAAAPAQAV